MELIVCVDDKGGMLFNNRRLSRDVCVCEQVVQMVGNSRLLMNTYSAKLFENKAVIVLDDPIEKAMSEDYIFVENMDLNGILHRFTKVTLFKWNRIYPSDLLFPMDELQSQFKLTFTKDFPGNSHEMITMEVYVR